MSRLARSWRVVVLWLIAMSILGAVAANQVGPLVPPYAAPLIGLVFFLPFIAGLLTAVIPWFIHSAAPDDGRSVTGRQKAKRGFSSRAERLGQERDDEAISELETLWRAQQEENARRDE